MTQSERIIRYMQDFGSITPMDAFRMGITKLATRVSEMRRDGMQIEDDWVKGKNQFGEPVRFKKYWLEEVQDEQIH